MNYLKIILYILILVITLILEYFLLSEKKWPWEIFSGSGTAKSLPKVSTDAIKAGKMCNINGTIQDYMGRSLEKTSVPCTQCIDYVKVTDKGCIPMQFDGTNCEPYGDPRPCKFSQEVFNDTRPLGTISTTPSKSYAEMLYNQLSDYASTSWFNEKS